MLSEPLVQFRFSKCRSWLLLLITAFSISLIGGFKGIPFCLACDESPSSAYFGIQIVDAQTGRGVPLVLLRTTGEIRYWTDSNGWVAFREPGLMDQEVFFHLESPGYAIPPDGFGFRGVRLQTTPGQTAQVAMNRINLAERLYRVTGQGIYRDSHLLNQPHPDRISTLNAGVIGQDSVQMVPYGGELFWLWGDTNLPHYPLGNFHVSAAVSPLPGPGLWQADQSVPLRYLTSGSHGRVRPMMPVDDPGAIWLFGLINIPDQHGVETLVAHYSRHLSLGNMVEHGVATWDPAKEQFFRLAKFDQENLWQFPRGQAVLHQDNSRDYVYFIEPFATTRVAASLSEMLEPRNYEAWAWDEATNSYIWQRKLPPATQSAEKQAIDNGDIPATAAQFQVVDVENGTPIQMHRASINWNPFRQRWIMIGCQMELSGKPSHLGEIWYAEAPEVTGPWLEAIKIASHPGYSFYNPRHHACLDERGGQVIYFEGTYTKMFSSSTVATPRYEYNQIMYRLDLSMIAEKLGGK